MPGDEAQLLKELQASVLFSADFPKRTLMSHQKAAQLSEAEQRAHQAPGLSAIRRVESSRALEDIIRRLAKAKYEPAVPTLAQLWRECALEPVRVATGHALREIGSVAARAALKELISDADHLSVFLAVRASFDEHPASAFERLAPHFDEQLLGEPEGSSVAQEVLATFCPSAVKGDGTLIWPDPRAPQWSREDRRWVQLCVKLRKHPTLGPVARDVLRYADAAQVSAELEAAKRTEHPRENRLVTTPRGDLVSRYRRGEHEAVWNLLREYEAVSGPLREEALEVSRETMKRVLQNANLLLKRLQGQGWVALGGALRTPPSAEDAEAILNLEECTGGPVPPSLKAFWEVVGGIDFVWDYNSEEAPPDFGLDVALIELDPISLSPARAATDLLEEWEEEQEGVDPELAEPFELDLAPDYLHKANISGGPPYGVELPFLGADPGFLNEEHGLPFVDYLRLAFRLGGFSRLDLHEHLPEVQRFIREMTAGFEPF